MSDCPVAHGMMFFSKSIIDLDQIGVAIVASSNNERADYIRDATNYKYWISDGSDDSTTETLTISFEEKSFDRIHLVGHNLKQFQIKYWDGASFIDFSTPINETINDATTNYYEFDSITTIQIKISMDTTQIADSEKLIKQFLPSTFMHKLEGYPIYSPSFKDEEIEKKTLRGRPKIASLDEIFSASLTFTRYPVAADLLFFKNLFDSKSEFLFWPCSGDESIFRFNIKGTRLEDIYLCALSGNYQQWFDTNTYALGINGQLNITQVN